MTGKDSRRVTARRLGLSLLLLFAVPFTQGCRGLLYSFKYTREEPAREALVGVWLPDEHTARDMKERGRYDTSAFPTKLIFNADGSFEMVNMPDWWADGYGQSQGSFHSARGQWRVARRGEFWGIELASANGTTEMRLTGQEPPYQIEIVLGDPDTGQSMFFSRSP